MFQQLFQPVEINSLPLKNRSVRSATHEGLGDEHGMPSSKLVEVYNNLAKHEVGMIVSGHSFVSANGMVSMGQTGLHCEECVKAWRPILNAVHAEGGKLIAQLSHGGVYASDAKTAVGPSPYAVSQDKSPCRELTIHEISKLVEEFAVAAIRARKAGFDGVQIHAAHGYLISEFLSPFYNKRTDSYGGSCTNRMRFLLEILKSLRKELPADYPVMVKINSQDFVPDGFSVEDCKSTCIALQTHGADAIELSGGIPCASPEFSPVRKSNLTLNQPVYYEDAAKKIKSALSIPLILVGGIRFPDVAERLLKNGICDLVSFSRPLVREPDLISRWKRGNAAKASCISCDRCFRPILAGKGIQCPIKS